MNNGNGATATQSSPSRTPHFRMKPRRSNLLWQMLGLAVAVHLVIILSTSKGLFYPDSESAQQIFEKGESAMAAGKYLEAMDYYQKVLDKQPKLPPVFERAAEQHRAADRCEGCIGENSQHEGESADHRQLEQQIADDDQQPQRELWPANLASGGTDVWTPAVRDAADDERPGGKEDQSDH